jgi:hypothetical protein
MPTETSPVPPPAGQRRSPAGLPILPLTVSEREVLRRLVRLHLLAVDLLNEAIASGRVDGALEALEMCGTLATEVERAKVRMGSNR